MSIKDHITVCICTYKRPELLRALLSGLEEQVCDNQFDYSIVIVDNDKSESARKTVESYTRQSKITISYYVEPKQNIALARNNAVKNSQGNFISFIDDDEFPNERWLLNLYKTLNDYQADGVLGPVLPQFQEEPPRWVLKGGFFERPSHPTGYVLDWKNTRTGNVLLKRGLFKGDLKWFDPMFGRGGEDRDFFRRKIEEGYVFIWSNEAPVYEMVAPKRWERRVLLKRALLRGKMAFIASGGSRRSVVKSGIAIIIYGCWLPLALMIGQHVFMKYLIKNCDHLGKISAFLGIDWVDEKYVSA